MHVFNSFLSNLHIEFNELYLIVQNKRVFFARTTNPERDSIASLVKEDNRQVNLTLCSPITSLTRLKGATISMSTEIKIDDSKMRY